LIFRLPPPTFPRLTLKSTYATQIFGTRRFFVML
jgi:hypothetical protein